MPQSISRTFQEWKSGVRFYIALGSLVATLNIWWWAHVAYGGTSLFATRLEEVFAWLALALITLAVSIGPFYAIFREARGKQIWFSARRLIGVSAAWFASLHVLIAYGALFHFANPGMLPQLYQRSFLFGAVALAVLLAMTATSFDRAFHGMGIWWFRLHRLVYVALLAILAHSFSIGVHATEPRVLLVTGTAASILIVAQIVRAKTRVSFGKLVGLASAAVALVMIFNYGYSHRHGNNATQSNGGYTLNG